MPINFIPALGQILMCDFASDGFIRPEMLKIRHCVVVSPRYRRHTGCCLIVPLSTVEPEQIELHHHRIPCGKYQCLDLARDSWVKGDMLTHAGFARLERPKERGRFANVSLQDDDLQAVRRVVLCAVGFPNLAQNL
jgi:mRNA interferase MazF